ncbi:hypothetical protein [Mycobacterium avium]|uniref:hypothetical protein n=1 Tax=Mycobacterium avium TaxID=1764 RepID=UPI001130C131|nr:hypothetical protein [Mycobacterium avium]
MPGYEGKRSANRRITRNPASGKYVIKPHGWALTKIVKKNPSGTDPRPIVAIGKAVIGSNYVDGTVHSFHGMPLVRREPAPTTAVGRPSRPGVDKFANSVLSALKGILSERLEALAAADIYIASLGTPTDVAEWMASALPASHPFDEITGPFYDIEGVSRRLRVPHNEVLRYVDDGRLLGCPTAEGTLVFPISQFNPDGSSAAGLERVLKTMATGTVDPWQIALWMNTPCEQLNDQTPAQTLQHGDARIVEELAAQTAARWRH